MDLFSRLTRSCTTSSVRLGPSSSVLKTSSIKSRHCWRALMFQSVEILAVHLPNTLATAIKRTAVVDALSAVDFGNKSRINRGAASTLFPRMSACVPASAIVTGPPHLPYSPQIQAAAYTTSKQFSSPSSDPAEKCSSFRIR